MLVPSSNTHSHQGLSLEFHRERPRNRENASAASTAADGGGGGEGLAAILRAAAGEDDDDEEDDADVDVAVGLLALAGLRALARDSDAGLERASVGFNRLAVSRPDDDDDDDGVDAAAGRESACADVLEAAVAMAGTTPALVVRQRVTTFRDRLVLMIRYKATGRAASSPSGVSRRAPGVVRTGLYPT